LKKKIQWKKAAGAVSKMDEEGRGGNIWVKTRGKEMIVEQAGRIWRESKKRGAKGWAEKKRFWKADEETSSRKGRLREDLGEECREVKRRETATLQSKKYKNAHNKRKSRGGGDREKGKSYKKKKKIKMPTAQNSQKRTVEREKSGKRHPIPKMHHNRGDKRKKW